jgi:DNA (cytosine-5)-methyltransferase 1
MFCGCGGSSCGARMAGALPVAGLDRWDLAAQTYRLNFPDAVVYHTEAARLAADRVQKDAGPIHLLLASPECTSHSVAKGKAPRCEKSRETAFEVIRFARVLKD